MKERAPKHSLAGQRFSRLLVLDQWERRGTNRALFWLCQCDCGSEPKMINAIVLRTGQTQSCGCLQKEMWASRRKQEPEPAEIEELDSKRFSLVSRGEWFGIFDNDTGAVRIVSREKRDAKEELRRQIRSEKKQHFSFSDPKLNLINA
jgi:hypothetical protein